MDTETSSEELSSTTDYSSTDSSDDDEKLETAQICGARLQLPQGLCERKEIFDEFFSAHTWNSLSEVNKQHLKSFLPSFPENDEHEKNVTLCKLFNKEVFRFTSPLQRFHEHLKAGHYRPDIAKMRFLIKKAERKELRFRHKLHRERLKNNVVESRSKLLNLISNLPPGIEAKMEKLNSTTPSYLSPINFQTKKRYFQELTAIRDKVEETGYSSDENYPEGPPTPLSRKQKRHLNSIRNAALSSEKVLSTLANKTNVLDLERLITPNCNPFFISEEAYKNSLLVHKRRRSEDPSNPAFNTNGITIVDIISRTDLSSFKKLTSTSTPSTNPLKHQLDFKPIHSKKKIKRESRASSISHSPELINKTNPFFGHNSSNSDLDSDSDSFFDSLANPSTLKNKMKVKRPPSKPTANKSIKKEIKTEPGTDSFTSSTNSLEIKVEDSASSLSKPVNCVSQYGKITPATLSDLDGIDMMNLPIDLEDSNIDILEFNNKPELMQETHANFLSLIRDIICSTNEHRMSMKTLEERLRSWQENPISPLNDWYSFMDNWVSLLPTAVNFLSGNFTEQPEDFVPYIEYKEKIDMFQWIGAGRDSDSLLCALCQYWLDHRNEMKPVVNTKEKDEGIEISDRSQTPPPPRCPTTWSIRKANSEEIKDFQEQERRRYNCPHKAFTYRCNGYESVVGPVKGIYNNQNIGTTKARGHSVLSADRPNYVTILTLVRDATARLPNGEGTRADICELLKSSQYLSINVPDNVLQSVVSGALDRMHTQYDPCVKYEPKRKVWIYLHRNRSEEDFERIHQQCQGMNRNLKKSVSKTKVSKPKPKSEKTANKTTTSKDVTETSQGFVSTERISKTLQNEAEQNISSGNTVDGLVSTSKVVSANKSASSNINVSTVSEQPNIQNHQRKETLGQSQQQTATVRKSPVKQLQKALDKQSTETSVTLPINSTVASIIKQQANKNVVKIISSNQGKSLIIPTSSAHILKQIEQQRSTPTKQISSQTQPVTQQLLQTIAQQKQLLVQKQVEQKAGEPKVQAKIPASVQQQILQTVTPQLQNIKNVTLLRNANVLQSVGATHISNSQASNVITSVTVTVAATTNVTQSKESVATTTSQQSMVQEQIVQSGTQNKVITQPRLTPAQQQQILQSLKQKVLPIQQTVMSTQYRAVTKPKVAAVQKQTQSITGTSLLNSPKINTTADGTKTIISTGTTAQTPLVAKVLTNAAGQVISVESLLAHQKQHGTLPQGTTLRISGTKSGQTNVIQLSAPNSQNPVTQFTVATQNIGQPKLVISAPISTLTSPTTTVTKTTVKTTTPKAQTTTTKFVPKIAQQIVNAKFVTQSVGGPKIVQPKVIVGQQSSLKIPISSKNIAISKAVGINVAANANTIRMVNAANLNIAQIGGKPVLITSKGNTFQSIQGQNIIIQTQANTNNQGLIISNTDKSNTNISQQSQSTSVNIAGQQSTQVILSPPLKVQQTPQVVLSNAIKSTTVNLNQQNQSGSSNQIVLGGQTVRLQTSGATNTHRVVLASQNQGQIITQQILLPVGFQGTPLNIKALQGLKVVPIAQAQGRGISGRQVFAGVVNPTNIVRVTQSTESTDSNLNKSSTE